MGYAFLIAMDDSTFQIRAFPDDSFQCDGEAQARMNKSVGIRLRRFKMCMVGMFAIFVAMILLAGIGGFTRSGAWMLTVPFVLLLGCCIFLIIRRPPVQCSACGGKFRKRWIASTGSGKDLFLVCEPCRRYVFTHLSSE